MPFIDTDAFATTAEVEARWARGSFGATTVPVLQAVLDWKAMRAVPLQGMVAGAGYPYTVYTGTAPISSYTSDSWVKGLETLLKMANAIGTILDIESALEGVDSDSVTVRSEFWSGQWDVAVKMVEDYLASKSGGSILPSVADVDSPTTWSLDTEW